MSRPRIFDLEEGTVSLQGFDSEKASALVEYIRNFGVAQVTAPVEEPPVSILAPVASTPAPEHFTAKTIGTYFDPSTKRYQFITVAVDPITKAALVEQVEDVSEFARESIVKFKRTAFDMKFI